MAKGNTKDNRASRRVRAPMIGLKAARIAKGLTQQDMADALDMTKAHYGKFELGLSDMFFRDAEIAARHLGVTIDQLG